VSNLQAILDASLIKKEDVKQGPQSNADPAQQEKIAVSAPENNKAVSVVSNNTDGKDVSAGGARPKTLSSIFTEDESALSVCSVESTTSTKDGSKVEGSPGVHLEDVDFFTCPFCLFTTVSAGEIQRHVNRQHLKENGEEGEERTGEKEEMDEEGEEDLPLTRDMVMQYTCPFCASGFDTPNDLSRHINVHHPDGEIGGGSSSGGGSAPGASLDLTADEQELGECPICGGAYQNATLLQIHVESHFATPVKPRGMDMDETYSFVAFFHTWLNFVLYSLV
jgi:uncharacterized C2H2 Zn-finger protein